MKKTDPSMRVRLTPEMHRTYRRFAREFQAAARVTIHEARDHAGLSAFVRDLLTAAVAAGVPATRGFVIRHHPQYRALAAFLKSQERKQRSAA